MLRLTLALTALFVSGCGLLPRPVLTEERAVRLPDAPLSVERMTRGALAQLLVDPGSVELRDLSEPVPGYMYYSDFFPVVNQVGWYWSVDVNARNVFGGYNGFERWEFLYDEHGILQWAGNGGSSILGAFRLEDVDTLATR